MKISVIGTGYVGLVAGACLAEMGNDVICVDNDEVKLQALRNGIIPIYEPGLEELVKSNHNDGRLTFSDNLADSVVKSQIIFIAVGTPQSEDGAADLQYVKGVAKEIGMALANPNPEISKEKLFDYHVIVDKSTVPVGTATEVTNIIKQYYKGDFDVVSNPEFLKQGSAVEDFLKPDRVIIGADSKAAESLMQDLYAPFLRTGNPVIVMDVKSAEMTKYASNSFLAVKISYANEIANICEKVGANAEMVRIGMCSDKRIGSKFLFAGLGYGGSCFPKDVKALINTANHIGCDSSILQAADDINRQQRQLFIGKILKHFGGDIKGKSFAVWGLAFKPNTNDLRMAPSITIINALLEKGSSVKAYDPKAMSTAKSYFNDSITYCKNSYETTENADALIVLTEWNEFRRPDFVRIKHNLNSPVIFDGRNQYSPDKLNSLGITYYSIGR